MVSRCEIGWPEQKATTSGLKAVIVILQISQRYVYSSSVGSQRWRQQGEVKNVAFMKT